VINNTILSESESMYAAVLNNPALIQALRLTAL
jgi:hypothetical protein